MTSPLFPKQASLVTPTCQPQPTPSRRPLARSRPFCQASTSPAHAHSPIEAGGTKNDKASTNLSTIRNSTSLHQQSTHPRYLAPGVARQRQRQPIPRTVRLFIEPSCQTGCLLVHGSTLPGRGPAKGDSYHQTGARRKPTNTGLQLDNKSPSI